MRHNFENQFERSDDSFGYIKELRERYPNPNAFNHEFIDLDKSYGEINGLDRNNYSKDKVLTKEVEESIIRERIQKERFWNMLVANITEDVYQPPKGRQTQILDLACSTCDEDLVLNSYFGVKKNSFFHGSEFNKNVNLIGIDRNPETIKLAQKKVRKEGQNHFQFIEGDATNLNNYPEISEELDVVIIRNQEIFYEYSEDYKERITDSAVLKEKKGSWLNMIKQGLDRLSENGVFIITSYTEEEHLLLLKEIKSMGANVVLETENEFFDPEGVDGIGKQSDKYVVVLKKKVNSQ